MPSDLICVEFQIEEGENRGPEMTAGLDNSATSNGAPGKKNDDGVFTVSVTGAYENDGFKVSAIKAPGESETDFFPPNRVMVAMGCPISRPGSLRTRKPRSKANSKCRRRKNGGF